MKKLFLSVILLGLFSSFSNLYARVGNWQSAYVIVNENDTLFGQVDFRLSIDNQRQCLFRKDERSEVIIFSPNNILGYRFTPDGKFYVSKEIDINGFPERVFVEFMVKGMLNLYYFVDNNNQSHFLFEDQDGEMFAITREENRIDRGRLISDNRFDGLIRYRFQEHHSIAHQPERFEFNQRSMINVARQYHNLTCPIGEECIVFENQRPDNHGFRTRITAYTAVEQYVFRLHHRGEDINQAAPAFGLGVMAEITRPQLSKNFGIYFDLSFVKLNYEHDFTVRLMQALPRYFSYDRQANFAISARTGFKYSYPIGNFTPGVRAGASLRYLFGEVNVTDFFHQERNIHRETVHFWGGHIALGTSYNLKNGQAVSLYLTMDNHRTENIPRIEPNYHGVGNVRVFSSSLAIYGLRLGYTF